MLADFIELGRRRVCFSLGGGSKTLYSSNASIQAHQKWVRVHILTVVLNILAGLYVSELLGLGEQEAALGDLLKNLVYGIKSMQIKALRGPRKSR